MLIDKNVTVYYQDSIWDRIFCKWYPINVYTFTIDSPRRNKHKYLFTETQVEVQDSWARQCINHVTYSYKHKIWKWKTRFLIDGKIYRVTEQNIDFINHNIEILKAMSNLEE